MVSLFPGEDLKMRRIAYVVGAAMLMGATAWMLSPLSARAEKTPSIKEIMDRAHRGSDSLLQKLGRELKSDSPDWGTVQKQSRDLVLLGGALREDRPPRGSRESWDRLTQQYLAAARELDQAAENKDASAAQEAHQKLGTSCMACHQLHKGK